MLRVFIWTIKKTIKNLFQYYYYYSYFLKTIKLGLKKNIIFFLKEMTIKEARKYLKEG